MSSKSEKPAIKATKPQDIKDETLDAVKGAGTSDNSSSTEKGFWDGYAGIFSGKGGWAGKDKK